MDRKTVLVDSQRWTLPHRIVSQFQASDTIRALLRVCQQVMAFCLVGVGHVLPYIELVEGYTSSLLLLHVVVSTRLTERLTPDMVWFGWVWLGLEQRS